MKAARHEGAAVRCEQYEVAEEKYLHLPKYIGTDVLLVASSSHAVLIASFCHGRLQIDWQERESCMSIKAVCQSKKQAVSSLRRSVKGSKWSPFKSSIDGKANHNC